MLSISILIILAYIIAISKTNKALDLAVMEKIEAQEKNKILQQDLYDLQNDFIEMQEKYEKRIEFLQELE